MPTGGFAAAKQQLASKKQQQQQQQQGAAKSKADVAKSGGSFEGELGAAPNAAALEISVSAEDGGPSPSLSVQLQEGEQQTIGCQSG